MAPPLEESIAPPTGNAAASTRLSGRSSSFTAVALQLGLEQLPLILLVSAYGAAAVMVGLDLEVDAGALARWVPLALPFVLRMSIGALLLALAGHMWKASRQADSTERIRVWQSAVVAFGRTHLSLTNVATAGITILLTLAHLRLFVDWKRAIPRFHQYDMDRPLARFDAWLHFGHAPWQLLQGLLAYPTATRFLDIVYCSWYAVIMGVVSFYAWSPHRRIRAQFLLAYFLMVIILGTIAATLLASGGPCYYGRLVPSRPDPFLPLMRYLQSVGGSSGLVALQLQRLLWEAYVGRGALPAEGISAMPSLHVAFAALSALVTYRTARPVGVLFWVYATVILVGSVHLGWHYAVDGYAGIVGALMLWWLSGRFLDWYDGLTCRRDRTGTAVPATRSYSPNRQSRHAKNGLAH